MFARERNTGHQNRIIIGGMDKYVAAQLARLALTLPPERREAVQRFPFTPYEFAPDRGRWLQDVEAWLTDLLRIPAPATPVPAPPGRPAKASAKAATPKAVKPRTPKAKPAASAADLSRPVTTLKGVDTKTAVRLAKLGVETLRDVLFFFPNRHLDRRNVQPLADLRPGAEATVLATVWDIGDKHIGPGRRIVEAALGDETGTLRAVWFNQPWVARQVRPGSQLLLSGRIDAFAGRLRMTVADYESADGDSFNTGGRLVPVYPLTEGLAQRTVRRMVKGVVDSYAALLDDPLPAELRARAQLLDLPEAVATLHYPEGPDELALARRRLGFDELFLLQIGLQRAKREWQEEGRAEPIALASAERADWIARLPFALTGAQQRVIDEIFADLAVDRPMARLLQGDVGSGKTVVAALALAAAVASGGQGAVLAPTEILANQHLATMSALLESILPGVRVALLKGSVTGKERKRILEEVATGQINVLVGTHAVIQGGVEFQRLLLGVVDEQHRFGVAQRAALRHKGIDGDRHPHMLVMTATPIPRTLALTVYGDLDLSVLDELPPGRQTIRTRFVGPDKRDRAYQFIREQVEEGRQAYVICPLVEESEKIEARAATVEFERLQDVFPDLRLGLLHGRMKPKEKDDVMASFRDGEIDVLVSTSVVEVGIDVPNATAMLIEGAERFGLSQLHQFRGRVGRGAAQSYCLLVSDAVAGESKERLQIVEKTSDGFALAEADLRLRGPGEFFGVRQSGLPELRVARLTDVALVEQAREEATRLNETDPGLSRPEHQGIRAAFDRLWQEGAGGDRS